MILFPNAKINLGLHILEKKADGFHHIESVIYPLPYYDVLEILPSTRYRVVTYGDDISEDKNIITKAWQIIGKKFNIPDVEVHLLKNIPLESGLGGGSSDAAHFIMALNSLFSLGLSKREKEKTASLTGSDCTFFIENRPALVSGKGDRVHPVDLSLAGRYIVLVLPDCKLSTPEAYAGIKPGKKHKPLNEIIRYPVEKWKNELVNDFESYAFAKYPELGKIKATLYDAGAVYASMSGSGSAVFGIFNAPVDIPELNHRWKIFSV
ncbi:MAG: 4-(cytidine 5'-diphospho)-2-C-methyl-D-erythritol kinase [Chlorobi bacterium]|nr:4-(cytidine 5'-diphospho)-2-C-methyl-D-erythritol kinase [Chlorobiota bacterium]